MTQLTVHRLRYFAADFLATAAGWLCFNLLRFYVFGICDTFPGLSSFLTADSVVLGQVLIPLGMSALYAVSGSYNRANTFYKSRLEEVLNAAVVTAIGVIGIWFTVLVNDSFHERLANYELLLYLYLCLFVPTSAVRILLLQHERKHLRSGNYSIRALVADYEPDQQDMLRRIIRMRGTSGITVAAIAGTDPAVTGSPVDSVPYYNTSDIPALCRRLGIQSVILLTGKRQQRAAELLTDLYTLNVSIFITPGLSDLMGVRPRLKSVVNEPLVCVTGTNISAAASNLKRLGDIVCSSLALVLLSPVYLALAACVKASSPGPVFYRQTRIGRHRRPFDIIKFRSMYVDAEKDGPHLTASDDPRVTRVGNFLRRYHLDELPQFWNVLRGDMSIVGPRPERDFYLRKMMEKAPASTLLFQLRPGITSWGMVKFGYASDVDQMIERLYYDILYLENVSLGTDLKILCHTVDAVLHGKGK